MCWDILYIENRNCPSLPNEIRDKPDICPKQHTFHNAYKLHRLPSLTFKTRETAFSVLNKDSVCEKRHSNPGWDPNHERYGEIETIETSPLRMLTFLTNFLVMTRWTSHTTQDLVPRVELGQLNVIFSQTSYKPAAAKSSSIPHLLQTLLLFSVHRTDQTCRCDFGPSDSTEINLYYHWLYLGTIFLSCLFLPWTHDRKFPSFDNHWLNLPHSIAYSAFQHHKVTISKNMNKIKTKYTL